MGRGDKRSKRGKIFKGSHGKSRPAKEKAQHKVLMVTGTKKA